MIRAIRGLPHITSLARGGGGVWDLVTLNDMGGRGGSSDSDVTMPISSDLAENLKSPFVEVHE